MTFVPPPLRYVFPIFALYFWYVYIFASTTNPPPRNLFHIVDFWFFCTASTSRERDTRFPVVHFILCVGQLGFASLISKECA